MNELNRKNAQLDGMRGAAMDVALLVLLVELLLLGALVWAW